MRSTCIAALVAVVLGGCTTAQDRDTEFRLQKLERERETSRRALDNERAKTTELTARTDTAERKAAASEAENSRLTERVQTLQQENEQYRTLLETRASEPLKRPEVPASLLPADVDAALQAFATKFASRLWYDRGRGAVSFANDQLFESGSDAVKADAHAALHELAAIAVKALPEQFEIVIVGHTDDAPIMREDTRAKHPTNWHLSVHRAIAVENVLERAGVPPTRMGVMGYGQYRPASNDPARNRRIEVFFVRKAEVQNFAPVRPTRRP